MCTNKKLDDQEQFERDTTEVEDGTNYKKIYLTLFNRITYAISQIDRMKYGRAKELLLEAQQETEEMYISGGE